MADNNKSVGQIAAAKLVSLIKAETAKKYDKSGGKIEGSVEITGGLKVGGSSEFSSSINAGSEISSDMLLMAPIVALYDPATEESIFFGVSGENAAKVTSPVSVGGTQYARLKVASPTEDNDAATKKYVDDHSAGTVDTTLSDTSTNPVQNKVVKAALDGKASTAVATTSADGLMSSADKTKLDSLQAVTYTASNVGEGVYSATKHKTEYQVDFNETTANIIAAIESGKKVILRVDLKELGSNETYPVYFASGYTRADPFTNSAHYIFAGTLGGDQFTLELNSLLTHATLVTYGELLPEPNPDGSDNGKVPTINGNKWELKEHQTKETVDTTMSDTSTNSVQNKVIKKYVDDKVAAAGSNITVDASLSSTSTNPVQNKVVKTALDAKMDKSGGTFTGNLTGKYITGTWLQTTEATDLGRTPGKIAVLDDSGWVYYRTPAELLADIGAATVSAMLDKAYPVGSIYMSVNSTNPKTLFGGTWVQIKDRFLLAAGTTYKAGATGGEATHTLTTSEMPSHNHAVYTPNDAAADHSAPGNYPDGTSDSTYYAVGSYTSSVGNGGAHNNMPPYLSVYVWKRTA